MFSGFSVLRLLFKVLGSMAVRRINDCLKGFEIL